MMLNLVIEAARVENELAGREPGYVLHSVTAIQVRTSIPP
jgi:hypothetical protein